MEDAYCSCVVEVPVLVWTLRSLMGTGRLFIISKLFIYFRGLSDPFLGLRGAGWVEAAGWRSYPDHPTHFRLTQPSQTWPGSPTACPHQQLWDIGGLGHRQSGWQSCGHKAGGSAHNLLCSPQHLGQKAPPL